MEQMIMIVLGGACAILFFLIFSILDIIQRIQKIQSERITLTGESMDNQHELIKLNSKKIDLIIDFLEDFEEKPLENLDPKFIEYLQGVVADSQIEEDEEE